MKKIISVMLLVVLSLTMLCGCVQKNGEVSASGDAAVNEKELHIYTALEDDQINDYLEGFKKQYPDVEVKITRDSTGVITSKLLAERDNPVADVVWGLSATSLLVLDQQDMLEPYAPVGVDRILPTFKDSANPPKWVGIDAWETAFLVNKEVLKSKGIDTVPQSYQDLMDPKYKGLIVMSNPASSGTGLLTVNAILQLFGEDGWGALGKIDANVAAYLHSGSQPAKMTATGEYGIGVSFGYRCIKSAKEVGPEIAEVVFPQEGSGWDLEANALMKKAQTKEIAKTFLDWAITDEAMSKYATNYPIVAVDMGGAVPEGYAINPLDQLIQDNDLNWAAENRDDILDEWTKRFDGKSAPKS